jgi:tripartite-type tricarboxylate transporter receptor subunit TctC
MPQLALKEARAQHNKLKRHSGMEAMQGSVERGCRKAVGLLLLLAAAVASPAQAEPGYPNRPVHIIVPYGPGGVADTTTRLLTQKMSERLGGKQFVIENRPGAGGIVAAKTGASAAPDGYTLTLTGNGSAISRSLFKSLPYDVLRDFTSVSVMAWLDLLIATKAGGPLKTVNDIVAAAKKNPGKLNFGTIAPGSTQNLSAELFRLTADIKVTIVTFRTTPELVTALMRGDVDVGFDYLAGFRPSLNDRQLHAVASTGEKRQPSLPDVPTVQQSGMPDYVVTSWNAVSAPAGTPNDIVQFLSKEIREALKSPDIQAKALQFGLDARGTTPEAMQERMRADIAKWAVVIEKAGIAKQ